TELGGPPVTRPSHRGLGTRVIERAIRDQLDGTVNFDWREEGLVCAIAIPFNALVRAQPIVASRT
ncbi:MAG TPA: hypothetical protein VHM01_17800, partial [Alphaproteobacteria bacterium]|nr:hypothetical protein [Alphaproteobacteria bacterium]